MLAAVSQAMFGILTVSIEDMIAIGDNMMLNVPFKLFLRVRSTALVIVRSCVRHDVSKPEGVGKPKVFRAKTNITPRCRTGTSTFPLILLASDRNESCFKWSQIGEAQKSGGILLGVLSQEAKGCTRSSLPRLGDVWPDIHLV
jgi:hypothetical protein